MNFRFIVFVGTLTTLALIAGCATQPKTLYYWGSYQEEVYDYLQKPGGGDIPKQIQALKEGMEKARASNQALPPGYHAQLGMLYYADGQVDQAVEQLTLEKREFPESATYIDGLLSRFKKN